MLVKMLKLVSFLSLACAVSIVTGNGHDSCDPLSQLTCIREKECHPEHYRCDGEADCFDGTDECGCDQYQCPSDRVDCGQNVCSKKDGKRCDGKVDCILNDHDEQNCNADDCLLTDTFHCSADDTCIEKEWKCDGYKDCSDAEDEKKCQTCHDWPVDYLDTYHCVDEEKCILVDYGYNPKCDGFPDCADDDLTASDEKGCTGRRSLKESDGRYHLLGKYLEARTHKSLEARKKPKKKPPRLQVDAKVLEARHRKKKKPPTPPPPPPPPPHTRRGEETVGKSLEAREKQRKTKATTKLDIERKLYDEILQN